jgi:hypothetical protein
MVPGGCTRSDTDDSDGGAADEAARLQAMRLYDDAVTIVQDEIDYTIGAVAAYEEAIFADDDVAVNIAIDDWTYSADSLIAALGHLEDLENTLQSRDAGSDGRIVQPLLFIIGAGATIYGIYKFARRMKDLSDAATERREHRDEAAVDMMNNVTGAQEEYEAAKNDMQDISEEAVVEVTTKVTSDLITAPMGTGSVGKIIVKQLSGDAVQKGLKVLASTTDCASGAEGECCIATGTTDSSGQIEVPAGKLAVITSAPDKTRAVVDEVTVAPDDTTTVTVDLTPIGDDPGEASRDTLEETDTGNGNEQGPKCAELEACCGNGQLDDVPAVLAECNNSVAKNAELDCSVMLTNLYWACD